jgi:hypothetical protein
MSDKHEESMAPPAGETIVSPPQAAPAGEWQQRAEDAERELALRRAIDGVAWLDPDDAYQELKRHAVRDANGFWRAKLPGSDASVESKSLELAAKELAARKPHWVKSRVIGGTGAGGGELSMSGNASHMTYRDLLKPENREVLRDYLYERPDELERLRQSHFKK